MWYLYSLFFCYLVGALLIIKIVHQAECNSTQLTDNQFYALLISMVIAMSIPLLNIIWTIDSVYKWILNPHRFENEIDNLIDYIRKNIL